MRPAYQNLAPLERWARRADKPAMVHVMRRAIDFGCRHHYGDDTVDAWLMRPNPVFEFNTPDRSLVLEDAGRIIGWCGWRQDPERLGWARIGGLFVHPRYFGQGYGTQLLYGVMEDISACQFNRAYLYATDGAHGLYEGAGFEDRDVVDIPVAPGREICSTLMERIFL